ncbi:MAG: hypothetical protein DWQ05_06990 [Calditrichaeota bacterium]|nr:MAG: hypothetical protein DWQ05_06990 [Calditrichota bacterium]
MIRMVKPFIFLSIIVLLVYGLLNLLILLPILNKNTHVSTVENPQINQASGLAASLGNPGILWTHNDKIWGKVIFALDVAGKSRGAFYIDNPKIRDPEDLAVGPGPLTQISYIYMADIGDNDSKRKVKSILRFPEPEVNWQAQATLDTIRAYDTIKFTFPDGPRDAETILLDPLTRDLFVISKRERDARVYKIAYPQKIHEINEAVFVAMIGMSMVVSGDISMDGTEILIKTYGSVYYWKREGAEPIEKVLQRPATTATYFPEPQGEAICWAQFKNGYFTISEELLKIPCRLVYYNYTFSGKTNRLTQVHLPQKK